MYELIQADLSSDDGCEAAVAAASEPGPLSGLVNLVGGFAAGGRLHEEPIETLEKMLALNLMTTARMCRAALPSLLEKAAARSFCVGAKHVCCAVPGAGPRSISKAAVLQLVKTLDADTAATASVPTRSSPT